jgi:hypothetical protein
MTVDGTWDEFLEDYYGLIGTPPESPTNPGLPPVLEMPLPTVAKSVAPQGQVDYGDLLTYTLLVSTTPGAQVRLYDPLTDTAFLHFVEQPTGIVAVDGVITGTLTVTPSNQVTVSFVAQVGAPGTAGWTVDVTNRVCVYLFGGTLGDCNWSNAVTNPAFRPYNVYLPLALRNH